MRTRPLVLGLLCIAALTGCSEGSSGSSTGGDAGEPEVTAQPFCDATTLPCIQSCTEPSCLEDCVTASADPNWWGSDRPEGACSYCMHTGQSQCRDETGCHDQLLAVATCAEEHGCSTVDCTLENCPSEVDASQRCHADPSCYDFGGPVFETCFE